MGCLHLDLEFWEVGAGVLSVPGTGGSLKFEALVSIVSSSQGRLCRKTLSQRIKTKPKITRTE